MRRFRSNLLLATAAATILIGASALEPLAVGTASVSTSALETPATAPTDHRLAQAVRNCDLLGAESVLEPRTDAAPTHPAGSGLPPRSLILGLAAESCGHFSAALDLLGASPSDDLYGDWRLYGMARSSLELGQFPAAKAALDRLRTGHPASPLLTEAILAAIELAHERGDSAGVAEIADQSRQWQLDRETSEAIEIAAWQAGSQLDGGEVRRAAAIQLLVNHPLSASKLEVVEEFRAPEGKLEWLQFLTPDQLVRRAESLFASGLRESAMDTLEEVPESDRQWAWNLASAQLLTASGRGEQALERLEALLPRNRSERAEHEWLQAFAALEISAPRSGRRLTPVQRRMMRNRAHQHLETAIALDLDLDRSQTALRILFEDALEDGPFAQALQILRRLKEIDPDDTSGARELWRLGWKQHRERNYSGAIDLWTELSTLYPTSVHNRSGLYWTARAHETLGDPDRSRQLLTRVADVPFTDFYRRHAVRRLGGELIEDTPPSSLIESWPHDPTLARAEQLSSVGLHQAALTELNGLSARAEPRAVSALKAQALAASGDRRQSIIEIKSAFPLLGTPFQGTAPEPARHLYYPLAFNDIIDRHSAQNDLDRNLILAMVRQESAFDPVAKSWAGARGLMQVMPATGREIARRLGLTYSRERLSEPSFSIQLGTTYYRQVRSMFGDDDELALAGYNAGPYRIKRLWRQAGVDAELDRFLETLALEETKSYVKRVLLFADSYNRLYLKTG